jgi:phosphate transport system substrate-binding protein
MCRAHPWRFAPVLHPVFWSLAVLLVACGEPVATAEPVYLRAAGSTTMAPLVADLATAFTEQQPAINLEVTGLGTRYGLDALRAGEEDVALVSWLPSDLDPRTRATAIGRDGIAIVVHPGNPVDGMGLLQLQDLFRGRVYEWRAVTASATVIQVQPVSREEGSGTRAAFETLVMDGQPVTPRAVLVASSQAVVDYVAGHPQAIGYVSMGFVTPAVKVLKIEGELPSPETAGRASYALTRELWLVTADSPPPGVTRFLDFVLSPAGQSIVGRGYGKIK